MEITVTKKEPPAQQVYIIQLDHNIQLDSQAIPLNILENGIDADLILPLLQQRQGQPLQLFVEPQKESTDWILNKYQRIDLSDKIPPNVQIINQVAPPAVNTMTVVQEPSQENIENSGSQKNKKVKMPIAMKSEPIDPLVTDSNAEFDEIVDPLDIDSVTAFAVSSVKHKMKNFVHMSDTKAPPRAIAVLPAALHLRGKLIHPRRNLYSHIRFGPVQGIQKIITKSEAGKLVSNATTPVFLLNLDEDHVIHIDVADKDKSNWMGLLPLGEVATSTADQTQTTTANVWLYEDNNELYALTLQPITARTPLKLGYGKKYCEDHLINNQPVMDLDSLIAVQWWCNECNRTLSSAAVQQRHAELYHKEPKLGRPSYRCKYCKKPFGRLYTMKRHMAVYCKKKPKIPLEKSSEPTETNPNPEPDISSTLEDNRIPSDESFQNFTNSLDFSTNLFDTDRIALDISAHSRPDGDPNDLNSYSMEFRDDNGLSNDLGFTKLTNSSEPVQSAETNQDKKTPIHTCSYCNQVVKETKSKHLRQCPSRLICECGRVFRHKETLAIHIHKSHPGIQAAKLDKDIPEEDKNMAYKCQECSIAFKRRGMLVNHLWRKHKMISTMPVETKVRHYPFLVQHPYPCVACPKVYRSSAKRNRHVQLHHPGAEKLHGHTIEGGVKCCQPASCSECPRQYATRAKLLQHIRARHPYLAKTINKQNVEKKAKTRLKSNYGKRKTTERYIATGN